MGDMNERTGRKTGGTALGKFGKTCLKLFGERLLELSTQKSLKIWHRFFNHKNIHGSRIQKS